MSDLDLSAARKAARRAVDQQMRARTYDRHAYDEETYLTGVRDIARDAVTAAAPLIERQVREMVEAERGLLSRFPDIVEEYGTALAGVPDVSVARIGEALIDASRRVRDAS